MNRQTCRQTYQRWLRPKLSGAPSTRAQHLKQAGRIAVAIYDRYGVVAPGQLQAKHLRWVLAHHLGQHAKSTRYDYWRTVKVISAALGRWDDWRGLLDGVWSPNHHDNTSKGGRPAKLPGKE